MKQEIILSKTEIILAIRPSYSAVVSPSWTLKLHYLGRYSSSVMQYNVRQAYDISVYRLC